MNFDTPAKTPSETISMELENHALHSQKCNNWEDHRRSVSSCLEGGMHLSQRAKPMRPLDTRNL